MPSLLENVQERGSILTYSGKWLTLVSLNILPRGESLISIQKSGILKEYFWRNIKFVI